MEWLKSQKGEKARKEGLGGPAFRPSCSNAVGAGLIPGRAVKTPHAWCPKHGDISASHIVTNPTKILKTVHIKKRKPGKNGIPFRHFLLTSVTVRLVGSPSL